MSTIAADREKSELDAVLSSGILDRAPTLAQFLTYVCSKYFEGATEDIKEYNIAVQALGRPPDFDQKRDSIVRVEAHKLRRRLHEYYEAEGADHEIRIEIPPGQYAPKFVFQPAQATLAPALGIKKEDQTATRESKVAALSAPRPGWRKLVAAALGVLSVSVLIAITFYRQTNLDRFWEPVMRQPGPVLICIGQPKTYAFNRSQSALDAWFTAKSAGQTTPAPPPPVTFEDLVPTWDHHISIDDAQAFVQISSLFAQKGRKVTLRGGRSVALADLRGKPCVLIGAFNNDWTLALAGELRFNFVHLEKTATSMVQDRLDPRNTAWAVANAWPYTRIAGDYAIVTRARNATTEQWVVIGAGITQFGTVAAGEFLSNPTYFDAALKTAPRDWYRKNMQVVLSVKVMSGTAGPPNVLAVHFW
jgi:hypothetical protein